MRPHMRVARSICLVPLAVIFLAAPGQALAEEEIPAPTLNVKAAAVPIDC